MAACRYNVYMISFVNNTTKEEEEEEKGRRKENETPYPN